MQSVFIILPLLLGWFLDLFLGDPAWLPHPVVGFGKMIAFGERRLNKGTHRKLKGALMAIVLISTVFAIAYFGLSILPPLGRVGVGSSFCCPSPFGGDGRGSCFCPVSTFAI